MTEIPIKIIELEKDNFHLLVIGKIGRSKKMYWIVDTGASRSVFDIKEEQYYKKKAISEEEEYQSAGINPGKIQTGMGTIHNLKFGKLKIKEIDMALIDLQHVNNIYEKFDKKDIAVVGLIGSDILNKYGACIDFSESKIQFKK
ncbi:MAG: aspartyl protease family protein [Prolixibacteraceae bacterium]|nr:aspartyl protease family protein [Prolixibacteraceae bacterium]